MASKGGGYPGYTRLVDGVYVLQPDEVASTPSSDPTTIFIFAWADGAPKHHLKYADGYRALFPGARIVIVRSAMFYIFHRSIEGCVKDMQPLVRLLFDGKPVGPGERILVEAMSNSGTIMFTCMLLAYRQAFPDAGPLAHALLVFDSGPGSPALSRNLGPWTEAMTLGTARYLPWPAIVTRALWALFVVINEGLQYLIGGSPLGYKFSRILREYTNPELVPTSAPRVYVYSKQDRMNWWKDVEDNIAAARQKGYDCRTEVYEESTHVGHMRADPTRYWGFIDKTWKEAMAMKSSRDESA